ncbi:MAG TPA: hypothetical protein VHI78_01660 [Bacteroidales bacterium]|jgi:hypothetical protein|nr:hypothetical protein [Bacteroidales bacterium]
MKKAFIFLSVVCSSLIIIQCENNPIKQDKTPVSLAGTVEGGCNVDIKSTNAGQTDTALFNLNADTLNVFVGINYACCAPFTSSMDFRNDSIIITVRDACVVREECYCRCICYYTWDFKLTGFDITEYPYKIMLEGFLAKTNPECIQEGTVDIAAIYHVYE